MSPERAILRDALGIAIASGAYAISFGAISTAGGSVWAGAATAALLGSRNALYGVRLSTLLGVRGARRVAAAHFVIDETTAMAIARDDPRQSRYAFWATGFALFVFWNVGTLIGALATQAIPNPKVFGLDAAPPAAFLALLAPRLRSREPLAIALASAAAAIVLLPFVPAGVPLLVIAVLVALYGVTRRR